MKSHEVAAHLRLLGEPGYDAKKLLARLAKAGYQVFIPGDDGFERDGKAPVAGKASRAPETRRAELERAVRRSRLTENDLLKENR